MSNELQEIKEEIARLGTRLDNVEGYFDNFNTTLTNHMTDYKREQKTMGKTVGDLTTKFNWGFWVIFSLLTTVICGFIAITAITLGYLIGG